MTEHFATKFDKVCFYLTQMTPENLLDMERMFIEVRQLVNVLIEQQSESSEQLHEDTLLI